MSTEKKISAGDALTVGDLTDDYLGAVIEVETLVDITYRFTLGALGDDWYSQKTLWTTEVRVGSFYPNAQVKVITPPPVVQPDEPTVLGQLVRIEGDEWLGMVAEPQDKRFPILDTDGGWWRWGYVLSLAGDRQIIVSDPPRWPDETPEAPERIEVGEWPNDDTHLREWVWVEDHHDCFIWIWYEADEHGPAGWRWRARGVSRPMPNNGPWTRGERVE